jgi:hypothetical protein
VTVEPVGEFELKRIRRPLNLAAWEAPLVRYLKETYGFQDLHCVGGAIRFAFLKILCGLSHGAPPANRLKSPQNRQSPLRRLSFRQIF